MAIDTRPTNESNLLPADMATPEGRRAVKRRRRLRAVGKYLITLGLLTIAFVGYEYWGTGYLTQRAQNNFRRIGVQGFVQYEIFHGHAVRPGRRVPGGALGYIRIPRIGLDMVFVDGSDRESLKKGPGHYDGTPLPGQGGNVAIAGHRTTYLHPFWALNELRPGDRIMLETSRGVFVYKVIWVKVTLPTETWMLGPTDKPALTLTTCNPRFSARERLDVRAVQISGPGLDAPAPPGAVPASQAGE